MQRLRFFLFQSPAGAACMGITFALFLWFSGCAWKGLREDNPLSGPAPQGRISLMAYNVENLFDDVHDPDHQDFPFLPFDEKKKNPLVQSFCSEQPAFRRRECFRLDWNESVLRQKLQNVANAILQVHGRGPDILTLEEVENARILSRLNSEYLREAGYKTVVWKPGPDPRGIAVGLLSRLPLAGEPGLWPGPGHSRGLLHVPLKLPAGEIIHVIGVHLPSQMNPVSQRAEAVALLKEHVRSLGADALWVVMGDWNISAKEEREFGFFKDMEALGSVSHFAGCRFCPGTHFYRGEWGFLDAIVVSKNLTRSDSPYILDTDSIQTPNHGPDQVQKNGRPRPFSPKKGDGASDHLPIYAEIRTGISK